MDHPYSGVIAIDPSDFQLVLTQVMGG